MNQPDVLYLVEHAAREFDIACIVKYLLSRDHGVEARIASLTPRAIGELRALNPRVVAVPFFYGPRDWGVRDLVTMFPGARFVNLAFEQVLLEANKALKAPRHAMVRGHVLHLAVGDFFRDYLVSHGVTPGHVRVIGSVGMALNRPPYSAAFEGRRGELAARFAVDAGKPWLFFPENYGAAFWTRRQLEQRIEAGLPADQAHGYKAFAQRSFRAVVPWLWEAARRGGGEIVVRPRPSTARDAFVAACEAVAGPMPGSGLKIIKEGTIREWQFASQVVASSYSTTLIDAAVAGRPAMMVAPEPFPDFMHAPWYDVAPRITDARALIEAAESPPDPAVSEPLGGWAEAHLLARGDPIANLVAALAEVCRTPDAAPPPPAGSGDFVPPHGGAAGRARPLRSRIKDALLRRERIPLAHEHDAITPAVVAEGVRDWAVRLGG